MSGRGAGIEDLDDVDVLLPALQSDTTCKFDVSRIGCVLHILHVAMTAGLTNKYFLGPLGTGSWNEWTHSHLVALLGTVWYNTSMVRDPSLLGNGLVFSSFGHVSFFF